MYTLLIPASLSKTFQILDPWFYILFRIFFHDKFLAFCGRIKDFLKFWLRCCCYEDALRENKLALKTQHQQQKQQQQQYRRKSSQRQSPQKLNGAHSVIAVVDHLLHLPKHSVNPNPPHYGTKPGDFETSKIHFPTSEEVSEVSE